MSVQLALAALGSGLEAASIYQQGRTEKALFNYSAAVDEWNAREVRRRAGKEAERFGRHRKSELSAQRAVIGASGVTFSGSAADVIRQDTERAALDTAAILYAGEIEAFNIEAGAAMKRVQGRAAKAAGTMRAVSSLLRGGAQAASIFATGGAGRPTLG